jgi:inner membrane protein YidH
MTDELTDPDPDRFQVKATADSHFSWLRTRLSVERTLMSWVRTSVALIGFGFTIVQFFERLPALSGTAPAILPEAPRYLGLALIGAGVLALVVSGGQYRRILAYLWGREFEPIAGWEKRPVQTPLYLITIAMIFIGLFAFGAVLLRAV